MEMNKKMEDLTSQQSQLNKKIKQLQSQEKKVAKNTKVILSVLLGISLVGIGLVLAGISPVVNIVGICLTGLGVLPGLGMGILSTVAMQGLGKDIAALQKRESEVKEQMTEFVTSKDYTKTYMKQIQPVKEVVSQNSVQNDAGIER